MGREIVEDNDISLAERRSELGFDPGLEDAPVHRLIDDKWGGQGSPAQTGDEGLRFPMSERCLGSQPPPFEITAPKPCHLCRRAGLIDENQPVTFAPEPRLAVRNPLLAGGMNVRAILF